MTRGRSLMQEVRAQPRNVRPEERNPARDSSMGTTSSSPLIL